MSDCPFRERPVVRYSGYVRPTLISCPMCGRCDIPNFVGLVEGVEARLSRVRSPAKVAVMGCEVNGPGEAREADIGVACGKNRAALFQKGQVVKTGDPDHIIEELLERLPFIIVEQLRVPTLWLCWCDMSSACVAPRGREPCFAAAPRDREKERERFRQSCPHRAPRRAYKGDKWTRILGSRIPHGALVWVVRFYPRRRVLVEYDGERMTTMLWCLRKPVSSALRAGEAPPRCIPR